MKQGRNSNRKKKRSQGFRARSKTPSGRKILSRQRAVRSGQKKRKPGRGYKAITK